VNAFPQGTPGVVEPAWLHEVKPKGQVRSWLSFSTQKPRNRSLRPNALSPVIFAMSAMAAVLAANEPSFWAQAGSDEHRGKSWRHQSGWSRAVASVGVIDQTQLPQTGFKQRAHSPPLMQAAEGRSATNGGARAALTASSRAPMGP